MSAAAHRPFFISMGKTGTRDLRRGPTATAKARKNRQERGARKDCRSLHFVCLLIGFGGDIRYSLSALFWAVVF
jgi:hypothetical protein